MADYLLFTLYSPLSSWGEIAVGEVRASKTHPGRSAVFGLIAAALGIRRNDSAAIKNLHDSYGLGVKVISAGNLIKDFHTIEAARTQRNVVYRRRADELNADSDFKGTLISTREYRSDALYVVSIWNRTADSTYSLFQVKNALESPVFVPYLGRKSCPPACNFAPEIIVGKQTLKDAFDQYEVKPIWFGFDYESQSGKQEDRVFRDDSVMYYWDDCENSGLVSMLSTDRYDTVTDSARRQFSARRENMVLISKRKD